MRQEIPRMTRVKVLGEEMIVRDVTKNMAVNKA